ncbi:MAG TPA: hypothetical protein VHL57_04280, partial [Flavobacteriales bacterium]|nr:hypothetical protein [Flavobacteriales bacterium]
MRRKLACLLIAAMGLPFVLIAVVLVRFHVERDRIIKEVCVQRAVPEARRTCHGQCHLKKQLEAEPDEGRDASLPPAIELRSEPAIVHDL